MRLIICVAGATFAFIIENEVYVGSQDLAFGRTKEQGNKAKLWDF